MMLAPMVAPAVDPVQCLTSVVTCPAQLATDAAGGVATSALDSAGQGMLASFWGFVAEWILAGWTKVDTPDLQTSRAVVEIQSAMKPLTAVALLTATLLAAGRMIWNQTGEPLVDVMRSWLVLMLVSGIGLAAMNALLTFGDEFSDWIISRSADGQFATVMTTMSSATLTSASGGLFLVMGLLGLLSSLVQAGLMLIRIAFVTLFAGMLPFLASTTSTRWGEQWFQRATSWCVAFILLKPAAALVYAAAFWMIGDFGDLRNLIAGSVLVILAVFTLPALVKLIAPPVTALTSGGGGGMGMAAGMALASGARMLPSGASGGGAPAGSPVADGGSSGAGGRTPQLPGAGAPQLPSGGGSSEGSPQPGGGGSGPKGSPSPSPTPVTSGGDAVPAGAVAPPAGGDAAAATPTPSSTTASGSSVVGTASTGASASGTAAAGAVAGPAVVVVESAKVTKSTADGAVGEAGSS